jgi:hypothetical protein
VLGAYRLDDRALAFLRVALGLVVLADIAARLPDVAVHYGASGVLPPPRGFGGSLARGALDLFALSLSPTFHRAILASGLLFAAAFALGAFTRLAQLGLLLVVLSIQNRNPLLTEGADVYLRVVLFWSFFLPLGRSLSVDAWRRARAGVPSSVEPAEGLSAFCYAAQLALVYACSVLAKLGTPYWRNGNALWLALQVDAIKGSFGSVLLSHQSLLAAATFAALVVQALAAVLLLVPPRGLWLLPRRLVIGALVGMHAGISCLLDVGLFPAYSIASAIPLAFPADADRDLQSRPRPLLAATKTAVLLSSLAFVLAHLGGAGGWLDTLYGNATGLRQRWVMFSGIEFNPVVTVIGELDGGERSLVFALAPSEDDPGSRDPLAPALKRYRWKKLFVNLGQRNDPALWRSFAGWLCRVRAGALTAVDVRFEQRRVDLPSPKGDGYSCRIECAELHTACEDLSAPGRVHP